MPEVSRGDSATLADASVLGGGDELPHPAMHRSAQQAKDQVGTQIRASIAPRITSVLGLEQPIAPTSAWPMRDEESGVGRRIPEIRLRGERFMARIGVNDPGSREQKPVSDPPVEFARKGLRVAPATRGLVPAPRAQGLRAASAYHVVDWGAAGVLRKRYGCGSTTGRGGAGRIRSGWAVQNRSTTARAIVSSCSCNAGFGLTATAISASRSKSQSKWLSPKAASSRVPSRCSRSR